MALITLEIFARWNQYQDSETSPQKTNLYRLRFLCQPSISDPRHASGMPVTYKYVSCAILLSCYMQDEWHFLLLLIEAGNRTT
jgi:hypothetical protein